MGPTFSMMAAGLLVAQTSNPFALNNGKPCACQQNAPAGYIQPVANSSPGILKGLFQSNATPAPTPVEERPTLFARVQGFFGKKTQSDTFEPATAMPVQQVNQPMPAQYRTIQRLPTGQPQPNGAEIGAPLVPLSAAPARALQPVTYQAVPSNQIPAAAVTLNPAASDNVPPASVNMPSRPNRISPELVSKVGHESDYSWITGQIRIENGRHVIHYAPPEVIDAHNGSLTLSSDRDLRGFQDGDFVSIRGSIAGRSLYRVTSIDRLPR